MLSKSLIATLGLLAAACVYGADGKSEDGWSGTGEAGLVSVRGNTESQVLNLGLELSNKADIWENTFKANATNAESNDEQTAESYSAEWLGKRDFDERQYAFGNLRYLDDQFDSFDGIITAGIGYGYRVILNDRTQWELSAGLGYRDTELENTGEDISGVTFLGFSSFKHELTESTTLTDELRFEGTEDNNFVENVLGLAVAINDALALKISYNVRYNSDPAAGDKNTDTITSISLVYNFK